MSPKRFPIVACAASLVLAFTAPSGSASILLTSEDFTILGGTAITSTGVVGTVIGGGNVGLSPGATSGITGFPPAVIQNGAIIATGPVTGQARLDLAKAKVGLDGMPSDKILSNVDLGGKTLRPGVYTFSGAASLTGALVLDARGRNGAFWVFQIATSLTTAANSSVTVINPGSNGGRDCGIFWNAGSGITFGAKNRIAGNYLAGTSITFGGKCSGAGRALARAGVSLDHTDIDAQGGPGGSDWSGGLKYNAVGAVVPDPKLAFSYSGKSDHTTSGDITYISGKATVTAADIQWRVNGGRWHTVTVKYAGKWRFGLKASQLAYGSNRIQVQVRDSHGQKTDIRNLTITRVR